MKLLLTIIGVVSLLLGIIGIVLPFIPTTPFLLLSSYCFVRSNNKLHTWLLSNERLAPYIMDFDRNKGMRSKTKIKAILLIILTMSFTSFYITNDRYVRLFLLITALSVAVYILSFNTRKD